MLNQVRRWSFCREESGAAVTESSNQRTSKEKLETNQSPSYRSNSGFSISLCL